MTIREAFAQGVRCGHIDGKNRVGFYVTGEEEALSYEAEENGNSEYTLESERESWRNGYCHGYRLGADGELLPLAYQYPVTRKPSSWE